MKSVYGVYMKVHNKSIKERGVKTVDEELRRQCHALKLGETFTTRDRRIEKLAGSLSRATKRTSGTRFAVRLLPSNLWEVQLVRYY